MIILFGWAAKTVIASFVGPWAGGSADDANQWMAYSIP